jgi:hypothetical protein
MQNLILAVNGELSAFSSQLSALSSQLIPAPATLHHNPLQFASTFPTPPEKS